MQSSKLAEIIDRRYNFAKENQQDLFDDFARYKTLWRSKIQDQDNYPWDYALFNPMVYSTVRSFVARVATGNVGVTLQAWNEQLRPKTAANKQLLEWEFREANLFLNAARAIWAGAMYGKAYFVTGWKFEKARVIEEEDETGNVVRQVVMSQTINRADLKTKRIFDMFVANRNIPDLCEQPWIIYKDYKTYGELKSYNEQQGKEVYKNLAKIKKTKPFTTSIDYGTDVKYSNDEELDSGILPIIVMYDRFTGRVCEMVEGHDDLLLRDEDNVYYHGEYPIEDLTLFPEDDEFFSPGMVMPIEDLQIALNSVLNQYLTNGRQQLNNMWIVGDQRIPDWELISRPNGVIHSVGDINNIREVQHKDITSQSITMHSEIEKLIQRTSGINDFLAMGQPSANNGTAAGLNLEQSNLDQNLKLFLGMLEQVTITRLATKFLKLNAQYITDEQVATISGKNITIKPDDVSAEFTPIVIPNSTLPKNPMIRLQNLENMKAMADKEQQIPIDKGPIWREMVSTMGMTDLDAIVPNDRAEALEENDMMKKGIPVECEVNDNHDLHIAIHQYELLKGQLDQQTAQLFLEHIKTHKLWKMSQDPELLDKLSQPPQLPQVPQPTPGAAIAPMPAGTLPEGPAAPLPNAATNEQGLLAQLGQRLGQAAAPNQPPVPINVGIGQG